MCPVYDWACTSCDARSTTVASSRDDVEPNYKTPPDKCELCGAGPEKHVRVIDRSSANFILKGDGWYRDSFSSSGKPIK